MSHFERKILSDIKREIVSLLSPGLPAIQVERILVAVTKRYQIHLYHTLEIPKLLYHILKYIQPLWPRESFKYNVENIFECYPTFIEASEVELQLLVEFANWMHILFQIISPKKNKGLSMRIITHLVEGPAKIYKTGINSCCQLNSYQKQICSS